MGGPVAAAVELAPGDDIGVVALGEPADRPEVVGEARQADGHRGRPGRVFGMLVLVVEAGRRCRGVGQPVDRDVGQDLVGAERVTEQLAAPGELTGGRVGQRVSQVCGWASCTVVDRPFSMKPCRNCRYSMSSWDRPSNSAGSPEGKEKIWLTCTPIT